MTPKQSLTRKQSLIRRSLAVLSAALLAGALTAIGISAPAGATGTSGAALRIVSVTDVGTGLPWPVQNRPFDVVVKVVDAAGDPAKVSKDTKIVLTEISGPGVLRGNTTAIIRAGGSRATISGAKYSQFANNVKFRVSVVSGDDLAPDKITVEVALTAVARDATPGKSLDLTDPACAAPTPDVPTCGQLLLAKGASGRAIMSVGSCDGLADCRETDGIEALVITAIANLKGSNGKPLYSKTEPATAILICDKVLCGGNGVPKIPVIYTLNNTGPLTKVAPPCPKKGVIGEDQEACTDFVQSHRNQGDLYLFFLFNVDIRFAG